MPQAQVNGITLNYELRGSGPTLMMINGVRRPWVAWMPSVLEALEQHFTVLVYDARGTGQSDKPQETAGYSMEAFADDAAALLKHLGRAPAFVFGCSMGGMVAQTVATRHPEVVKGLALGCTNTGPSSSTPPEKRIWELLRLFPNAEMTARDVARKQEEAYYAPGFAEANGPLLDAFFEAVNVHPTPEFAAKGHFHAIEHFDGSGRLKDVQASTLVITGADDVLIPAANSERIAREVKGAELVLLKNAAHLFWLEKPQETADALASFFAKVT